jgi:uncharacterized membrane protein YagU involved in acid resistance
MQHQYKDASKARGDNRPVRQGFLAGLVGGFVACWAMNQWLALWQRVVAEDTAAAHRGRPGVGQGGQLAREGPDARQPPTMHAAAALLHRLVHHPPTDREKQVLGQVLHYTVGTATGALYGALAAVLPAVTSAKGVPFGLAVWLLADELAVPALGLSQPPTQQAGTIHVYALTAHGVYGFTTEWVRGLLHRSF